MLQKNTTTEKQRDINKEIKNIGLEEKAINKQESQILKEIKGLEIELARILKKETAIENKIQEIEESEKIISPEKRSQIEKKRWKADAKRREIEKAKWTIQEKIEKVEEKMKLIELKSLELSDKKKKLGKAEQEIFQKNKDKELAREKVRLQNKIFQLASRKKTTEKKHEELLKRKSELESERVNVLREERIAEEIVQAVAAKEKTISDPKEKRKIEKQRWQAEDSRKLLEKSKWELEKKQKKLSRELKRTEKKHQETLNKEKLLKEKIKEINGLLKISPEKSKEKRTETQEKEIQQKQELKRYREELVKQYEEELKKQTQELIKQHKKELEEKKSELEQKKLETEKQEQKIIQSQEIIKEKYIPYIPRGLVKQQKLTKQLETEEEELKKQHKRELSRQEKELMRRRKKELIQQEEKIIRIQHEELRKEEKEPAFAKDMAGKEEKLELTEKQKRKKQEDLAIRRKAIQMEVERIEQEELKREELEKTKQEHRARTEKEETERQKKTEILEKQGKEKGVIKDTRGKLAKKRLLSKQEIQEKEQKEKELQPVFELAVKHYKEKKFNRAEELFTEVKEQAAEPEKEPRFLAKLLNKLPLYIKSEKYLERIEKQKAVEKKKIFRIAKRRTKKQAKQKKKEKKQAFVSRKEEWKKQPFGSRVSDFFRRRITFYHPIISIDISDHSIEILYLSKQRSILAYGRTIIEQGIVRDGEIIKQKALTQALRLTVQRAGFQPFDPRKGPYLRAIVSLPEFKTYIQTFTFDSRANLFEKVKQEIEKTIPFPINDLYWSYIESLDENSSKIKVLCAAVLKDIVNDQVHFFKASGINPIVFDIEAASLGRALLSQELKQSTIILDIGARTTNLNIFDKNGFIGLSATIPYAGLDFAAKIADHLGISKQKAETIMEEKGFEKQDNPFLLILEREAEKIVKEVQQSINYYEGKFGKDAEKVKKIILAGGLSLLPDIDGFFQKYFEEIKVEMGNPLEKIKRKGGMKKNMAILYSNAIGLALRSVAKDPVKRGINLLPEEIKLK